MPPQVFPDNVGEVLLRLWRRVDVPEEGVVHGAVPQDEGAEGGDVLGLPHELLVLRQVADVRGRLVVEQPEGVRVAEPRVPLMHNDK